MENLQRAVATVTIIFFCVLAAVLIASGVVVLWPGDEKAAACEPRCTIPVAPQVPELTELKADATPATQQISLFQQKIALYKEQRAAYEKHLDVWLSLRKAGPDRVARFEAVAKNVLLPLLTPIVAAFIAYAFVRGAANVVRNVMAARNPNADLRDF